MRNVRSLAALLLTASALLSSGCNQDKRLTATGSAIATAPDGTTTGFTLPTDTLLYDDRVAPTGGTGGHCTIRRGAAGTPDVISVGLSRTLGGSDGGTAFGMSAVTLRFDDPRAPGRGRVDATIDGRDFGADIGGACAPVIAPDSSARYVALTGSCVVTAAADTRTIRLDLQVANCTVTQ